MMAKERAAVKGGVSWKGEGTLMLKRRSAGGWGGVGSSSGCLDEGGPVFLSLGSFIV